MALSFSHLGKSLTEGGGSGTTDLVNDSLVLGVDGLLANVGVVRRVGNVLSIDTNRNIVVTGEQVGGVVNIEGAISVVSGGNGTNLELGNEISINLVTASGTWVAIVILDSDAGTTTTGKRGVGDLNSGVINVEVASTNLDSERSILDGLTVDGGKEGVGSGLLYSRVRASVSTVTVVLNIDGNDLASFLVDELAANLGAALGDLVAKRIESLDGEGVLLSDSGLLNTRSVRDAVGTVGVGGDNEKREGVSLTTTDEGSININSKLVLSNEGGSVRKNVRAIVLVVGVDINSAGTVGDVSLDFEATVGDAIAIAILSGDSEAIGSTSNNHATTLRVELEAIPVEVVEVGGASRDGDGERSILDFSGTVHLGSDDNGKGGLTSGLGGIGTSVGTIAIVNNFDGNVSSGVLEGGGDVGTTLDELVASNILGDDGETDLNTSLSSGDTRAVGLAHARGRLARLDGGVVGDVFDGLLADTNEELKGTGNGGVVVSAVGTIAVILDDDLADLVTVVSKGGFHLGTTTSSAFAFLVGSEDGERSILVGGSLGKTWTLSPAVGGEGGVCSLQ